MRTANNFLSFLVNEDIKIGGKQAKDDENQAPDYTADNPDNDADGKPEPPTEPDKPDDTTPAPEDNPAPAGDDPDAAPDYTKDSPDGGDEPAPDDGTGKPDDTTQAPEDNPAPAGDDPTAGDDPDAAPDYTQDNPEGDPDQPDAGSPDDEPSPDGGEDPDAAPDYTQDNPDGGDEPAPDDGGNPDGNQDNPDGGDGDNPNYTGDDPENDPDGNPDSNPDDTGDVGDGSQQPADPIDGEINQMQSDIFADMTPGQIDIKIKELKTQYITLFSDIGGIIERLSSITRRQDNIKVVDFLTKKYMELKDMIKDALVYGFDEKSYVQNQITLQNFMGIYANLNQIIEELSLDADKS